MKISFKAYLAQAEVAAKNEREKNFGIATKKWRSAYFVAPNQQERDWSYARAEHCFKRAVEEKIITIKKAREFDFKEFIEGRDD